MLEFYKEHWYLALVLLGMVIGALLLSRKAMLASAKRNRERDAVLAELKEKNEAAKLFHTLDAAGAAAMDSKTLFAAAALHTQSLLENKADPNTAFCALPIAVQQVYALHYLFEDAATSLSHFFKENGKPLTPAAHEAVHALLGEALAESFDPMYAAYDPDNETASLLPEMLAQWNAAFAAAFVPDDLYPRIAAHIRENFADFSE